MPENASRAGSGNPPPSRSNARVIPDPDLWVPIFPGLPLPSLSPHPAFRSGDPRLPPRTSCADPAQQAVEEPGFPTSSNLRYILHICIINRSWLSSERQRRHGAKKQEQGSHIREWDAAVSLTKQPNLN